MSEKETLKYYDLYFSNLKSFRLIKSFETKKINGTDFHPGSDIYSGIIEANDTCHPLQITVEIPVTFPHHKITFWTTSLKGYPHLIYFTDRKSSWFCLNAPFAETIEEQLNQELFRLEDWIKRHINPELEAELTDPKLRIALHQATAYEWENSDEIAEYNMDAMLTFVGGSANDSTSFKDKRGTFDCIRNESNKFYVCENKTSAKHKLPYIVVDEFPEDISDFLSIAKQFHWDNETCKHLLPEINLKDYNISSTSSNVILTQEEAFAKLNDAVEKLIIPDYHKEIVEAQIEKEREGIKENNGIKKESIFDLMSENECRTQDEIIEDHIDFLESEYALYSLHYYALGIKSENDQFHWVLCSTNNGSLQCEETTYNIGIKKITVHKPSSLVQNRDIAQFISEENYFGRGKLSDDLTTQKIALIGLGAIGSMVAETLVRSGVKELGLWDNDTVEPGNICRSVYTTDDLGESKVVALTSMLKKISPECKIKGHGFWFDRKYVNGEKNYRDGDFYSSINYQSQSDALKELDGYDLIIDCTASNELLHFLSYAISDKKLISLCITNHAENLICVTNSNVNPFDTRKYILSKIEQDTKNLYKEGTGCYSPTFYAKNCDIAALVNLAIRRIDIAFKEEKLLPSTIWSYSKRGVKEDELKYYYLESDSQIGLTISTETIFDGEDLPDKKDTNIGYLLGGYNKDGTHIFLTHIIDSTDAENSLKQAFDQSSGLIDYIGDFTYSWENNDLLKEEITDTLSNKAIDDQINTNNPLVATRNIDGELSFYLYMNGKLNKFIEKDN